MDELERRRLQVLATVAATVMLAMLVGTWWARPVVRGGIEPRPTEHRIDVNAAPAYELELLPGIGPAIAWNIVAHREAHGPFVDVTELEQVRMIGPGRRAAIAPWVVLEKAER